MEYIVLIPISFAEKRSVVSGGFINSESIMSSQPITEISSGIDRPFSFNAFIAPAANKSLSAIIAVKFTFFSRKVFVAQYPLLASVKNG